MTNPCNPADFTSHEHPAHMSLYPTMESLVEAIRHIENQVPITSPNQLFPLLMMYHNTLLKELCHQPCQVINLPNRLKELP